MLVLTNTHPHADPPIKKYMFNNGPINCGNDKYNQLFYNNQFGSYNSYKNYDRKYVLLRTLVWRLCSSSLLDVSLNKGVYTLSCTSDVVAKNCSLLLSSIQHFMLLLSIYVLYSNIRYNFISCIMSCGNKLVYLYYSIVTAREKFWGLL